jgi:hypothetical protein
VKKATAIKAVDALSDDVSRNRKSYRSLGVCKCIQIPMGKGKTKKPYLLQDYFLAEQTSIY